MMEWTKVTDALPPDGEAVMVTVANANKERFVKHRAVYDYAKKEWLYFDTFWSSWESLRQCHTVTHWAPMPQPAED